MPLGIFIMKTDIAIFGSCVCKDTFRSYYNPNYKEYFDIKIMQPRVSFISLMSKMVDFNSKEIEILPDTPGNRYANAILSYDLSKNFFEELKLFEGSIEFLLIDMYFEVFFGILPYEDTFITNNYWDYPKTSFGKQLNHDKPFSITNNYREYMKLWTKSFDKFYSKLKEEHPHIKIILNKIKMVDTVLANDGSYYVEESFKDKAQKLNPYMTILENYIISNYDVIFVDLTDNITTDENHIWGKSYVHYNKEYYEQFYQVMMRLRDGERMNYYYNNDNIIFSKKDIPSDIKYYKYTIMHKANENVVIEKTVDTLHKILDKTRQSTIYKYIK